MDTPARPFPVATRYRDGTPVRDRFPTDAEAALDVAVSSLRSIRHGMEGQLLANRGATEQLVQAWQQLLDDSLRRIDQAREQLADTHSRHVDHLEPDLRLAAGPAPHEPRRSRA